MWINSQTIFPPRRMARDAGRVDLGAGGPRVDFGGGRGRRGGGSGGEGVWGRGWRDGETRGRGVQRLSPLSQRASCNFGRMTCNCSRPRPDQISIDCPRRAPRRERRAR